MINNMYYEQPCLAKRLGKAINLAPLEAPLSAWQSQALMSACRHDGSLANARKARLALIRTNEQGSII